MQKENYQRNIKKLGLSYQFNNAISEIKKTNKLPSGKEIDSKEISKIEELSEIEKAHYLKEHRLLKMKQESYLTKRKAFLNMYSYLASILSIIGVVITLFSYGKSERIFENIDPILVSIVGSVIAGIIITLVASLYSRSKERREDNFENDVDYIEIEEE